MAEIVASVPENSTTIGDIANWVCAGKLKRLDLLTDAIDAAWDVYNTTCKKVPFDSLRHTSQELPLAANTNQYDLSTIQATGGQLIAGICSLRLTYSTGRFRRLRRSHVRVYDALGFDNFSTPATYARWGRMLEFQPGAKTAMTFRLRYWAAPSSGTLPSKESIILLTPTEWDELFKWETLYRMYIHLDMFEKAQQLVQPVGMQRQQSPKKTIMFETAILPRLWNDLLSTIDQRENVDEDFSINPMVRHYTRA
jgi:hypothetical protein